MKKIFPFLLLLILVQGCSLNLGALTGGVYQREWNLGACSESSDGTYGRTVKIPKSSVNVNVFLTIHRSDASIPEDKTMGIRIKNMESHAIELLGKQLEPNENFEFNINPEYWKDSRGENSGRGGIGSFNMVKGSMKIRIDILSGRPKGATIDIGAMASEGL